MTFAQVLPQLELVRPNILFRSRSHLTIVALRAPAGRRPAWFRRPTARSAFIIAHRGLGLEALRGSSRRAHFNMHSAKQECWRWRSRPQTQIITVGSGWRWACRKPTAASAMPAGHRRATPPRLPRDVPRFSSGRARQRHAVRGGSDRGGATGVANRPAGSRFRPIGAAKRRRLDDCAESGATRSHLFERAAERGPRDRVEAGRPDKCGDIVETALAEIARALFLGASRA